MKTINIFFLLTVINLIASSQDINNVPLHHMQLDHGRKEINIPGILGYSTLKCDFHIHTIFSDGVVWPEVRVQEAWEEGLDAIAITDHIENQPSKPYVGGDHNASYEIAKTKAENMGIILIRGGEITRDMPPGHFNALFLNDVNPTDTETPYQAIEAAAVQGAFIEWNHSGWKAQQPDSCIWWPEHEEFYQKGWINGIEVFNEKEWYPIALDWCMDKNVAPMGNSDIHDVNAHYYNVVSDHRPMTLVFAEGRSAEEIKEALFDKRTVAYFDNKLAGKAEYLEALFNASLEITIVNKTKDNQVIYAIKNNSDITYYLITEDGNTLNLLANRTQLLRFPAGKTEVKVTVSNLFIRSGENLVSLIKL